MPQGLPPNCVMTFFKGSGPGDFTFQIARLGTAKFRCLNMARLAKHAKLLDVLIEGEFGMLREHCCYKAADTSREQNPYPNPLRMTLKK